MNKTKKALTTLLATGALLSAPAHAINKKVGNIETTTKSGESFICEATMISEKHALTAARCIINSTENSASTDYIYPQIEFFPAGNEKLSNYTRGFVKKVWISDEYLEAFDKRLEGNNSIDFRLHGSNFAVIEILNPKTEDKTFGKKLGTYTVAGKNHNRQNEPITTYDYKSSQSQQKITCETQDFKEQGIHFLALGECSRDNTKYAGMPLIDQDNNLIGVTSSKVYEHRTAAILHQKERIDIEAIINSIDTDTENFTKFDIPTKQKIYVSIHNKCYDDIQVAYNYVPYGTKSWESRGFITVDSGEKLELFETKNKNFYYAAYGIDTGKTWEGDDLTKTIKGSRVEFRKKTIDEKFGDYKLTLTCNN